ncbi:MAG: Rrf2 family transcriptional regulator [Candidatus Omnitrophota bacterium]|nr:MAG: Rrf2 family transcriptional regulator [Candidatus Omnitrophota bacterium]
MKITYKGDYALKTILDLSLHFGEGPITINDLARRADIPIKFLEQILLDLKSAGFVESRRGKIGGYLLSRAPSEIKLGEVVRFIDGPIEPIACVDKSYKGCKDLSTCVFRNIWSKIRDSTSATIDSITFEDLARRAKESSAVVVYQI